MQKWVYSFGDGATDGNGSMKSLLGGKGANLAEMCAIGLPVPPGFTITTEACADYYEHKQSINLSIQKQVLESLHAIEKNLGLELGNAKAPLLVSVRSGARASMPGMMDTILNLGLNDETVEGLAKTTNNPRFAYDSYRRFIQMYCDVVLGLDHYRFEDLLETRKRMAGVREDTELSADDLRHLINDYKAYLREENVEFPQDVKQQLWGAIDAVFKSWMNDRAKKYRELNDIPADWGTAVNIQAMVFGNMGEDCATGVCFTRDPSTGDKEFYGEFLINAQGEDVVAGIRTPQQITIQGKEKNYSEEASLEEAMPKVYGELVETYQKLERHYRDMQDIEFTIQNGKLWILQTRSGKRTAYAAIKIAVDMVHEGMISKEEAIERIDPNSLDQLLHPTLDTKAPRDTLTNGLPASPGAAAGSIVFSSQDAENSEGKVILVRNETSPEDIGGMNAAEGILTARGGMTSHAAVVARGMGKPCVTGASQMVINYDAKELSVGNRTVKEGELITINGASGEVIFGEVPTIEPKLSGEFAELMTWVDEVRELKVRTNAETPKDASVAKDFGAEGIGLCRTEHMFFDPERIVSVREMILAETKEEREKALDKLLPHQKKDFKELFEIMQGLPVTIRLLDPPLHEFLPHSDEEMADVAKHAGVDLATIKNRAEQLAESNPMLGHRGCRLAITYPEIYEMQARAIFEAAKESSGVKPEIMVPLVIDAKELEIIKTSIDAVAKEVGVSEYQVGTMIELPRAALRAGDIANFAEFFSFGTNDLTQTTYGISRDDAGKFLSEYKSAGIAEYDPFARLDQSGVDELIEIATNRGREVKSGLKLGICGEHGGEPSSIDFCHRIGLDYVSCSPYRVPIARLSAAQSVIRNRDQQEQSKAA